MTSLKIAVPVAGEGVVYVCATGRSVGWAEDHIRETFNIAGGTVYCDEVGAGENELVEEGRSYGFVGGLIQGKIYALFSISRCCLSCLLRSV
jgi:hypothetical protein